jgi:threonine/homoserine/homoserine lactone efflux protein
VPVQWQFLAVVAAVVAVPGADFVMTLRGTLAVGRAAGIATALGVGTASLAQGGLAAIGLGALIVRSQPVFQTLRWLGVAYLVLLAAQSLRAAWRGPQQAPLAEDVKPDATESDPRRWARWWTRGFLCNATNPKMFIFYLSLLPQFVDPGAGVWSWLEHAWTLPLVGTMWLAVLVLVGAALRDRLLRPVTRRIVDTVSGLALLGFSTRIALDS